MAHLPKKTAVKDLKFRGSSLKDLCEFPKDARRQAGYQLDRGQNGLEPEDFKPMSDVGSGVQEIRIKDEAGIFRVLYVAKFKMRSMCCTVFRRRRSEPRRAISTLPASGMRNL